MSIRTTTLTLAMAMLLAAGCTGGQNDAPAPAPQSAQRESTIVTTATVEKVDQQTREVTLRGADGEVVTVVAGPEVRNLPQLAAGDVVRLTYRERVAARMAQAGEGGPASAAVLAGRAPEGSKPAGVLGAAVSAVVTFKSYDPATGVVTFTTHDGREESVAVDPAMQAFAAARRPGDRIAVDITSAVALSIVESPG
jgi:hypothetical protein